MKNLANTVSGFLDGITNKPYTQDGVDYNIYSYVSVAKSGNHYRIQGNVNNPIESHDTFPIPSEASISIIENDEGPYIGTVDNSGTQYFAITDCSGFIAYIVNQNNHKAMQELVKEATKGRGHKQPWPSAAQVANYEGGTYWTQVLNDKKVIDFELIKAGDIIAWDSEPGAKDTGHVMIAIEDAVKQDNGSYQVKVCDSTALSHQDDQRKGVKGTGVGAGIIGLRTKEAQLQSNFNPASDYPWKTHPHINILRLKN